MQNNSIAVIGGTGKSGKYVVKQLLQKGYQIKLLVRDLNQLTNVDQSIQLTQGDARDKKAIFSLLNNCTAVISTLGQPKGESSIFSTATRNVINAMRLHHIKRYIVTTGLSVNTPFDKKSEQTAFATKWMYENYPETTKDKQVEYELLAKSNVDWTMVRLPLIIETNESFPINVSLKDCLGENISATDLANFLVEQLDDQSFIKESPFIANV